MSREYAIFITGIIDDERDWTALRNIFYRENVEYWCPMNHSGSESRFICGMLQDDWDGQGYIELDCNLRDLIEKDIKSMLIVTVMGCNMKQPKVITFWPECIKEIEPRFNK